MAQIYADLGRPARRRGGAPARLEVAEEHLGRHPDDVRALYMGANGLVALGERERGLEWAQRALAIDPDEPMLLYNVACICSLAGDVEEALDCLERAVRAGHGAARLARPRQQPRPDAGPPALRGPAARRPGTRRRLRRPDARRRAPPHPAAAPGA